MKKIYFKNLLAVTAITTLMWGNVWGQVTTNSGSGLAATYTSLANAITALNAASITSPVVITLTGNETAPAGGYSITAQGTSTNTIIIQGSGSTITAGVGTSTTTDAIFKLVGADYITLQNFTMQESGSNTTSTQQVEWGVALLHASTTNGSQNNTIQNNTITLNKTNLNTFGIYSNNNHSATVIGTTESVTNNTTGPASGNKIYGNTISNVNMGIAFIGTSTAANQDIGNDIGGTSTTTGNTITNWGGAAASSSYISNSGTSYCIYLNHQVGENVSYNTITSATISGTSVTLRGIFKDYGTAATLVGTTSITNNTITITDNFISGTFEHIRTQGTVANTSTCNLNNNTILNSSMGGASSSTTIVGIVNSSAWGTLNINNNILRGLTSTATTGGITGISNTGAIVTAINLNNNQLGNSSGNFITFSAATSGTLLGITNDGGASTCALSISNNNIRGITHSVAGSSSHTYFRNTATTLSQNISFDTFTNLNVNTTGSVTFISNSVNAPAAGSKIINNNRIMTAFNKAGAGGTVALYTDGGISTCTTPVQNNNNDFSNITVTGATTITGWFNNDGTGSTPQKTITGNTFNNWTCGSSAVNVLQSNFGGTTNASSNTITNISGTGSITGYLQGSSGTITTLTIGSNTITGLSSTGSGGAVTGISNTSPATTTNINANTINNLSSTSTTATVAGISTSASANIFQNTINTLSCTGTTSGVTNGIMVTGGTAVNIYRNKIYDLSTTGAFTTTPGVNGIVLSGTTSSVTAQVYNNVIGDLRAAAANSADAIRGLSVTATGTTSNYRLYNNTVYLNASSSGSAFGTTGIFHATSGTATTAALDLRNNMVINTSSPGSTGVVTTLRRSSTALTNFATTSNRNMYFAGTAAANRTIMTDGTNFYQTYGTYFTAVGSTREANSFVATVTPATYFASTTGAHDTFLKPAFGTTTQAESGGETIALTSSDYSGATRPVSPGTAYDVGAIEFNGISPAPSISFATASPSLTSQCAATARTIKVRITTPSPTTITADTLFYSYNGGATTAVPAGTFISPDTFQYTIPVASPTTAIVAWSVKAVNSASLSTTFSGTSYSDEPNTGITATASATATSACAGSPDTLRVVLVSIPFTDLFNSSPTTQFSLINTAGTGSATQNSTYFSEGASSVLFNTASTSADVQFTQTNSINMGSPASAQLTFYHICATEAGWDYGYVQYSTNNGSSWTSFPTTSYAGTGTLKNSVVSFDKSSYADWNTQFTAVASTPGTGPATSLWKKETINIPAAALSSSQFKIRFRMTTDGSSNYYGWLIDSLMIRLLPTPTSHNWIQNNTTVVSTAHPYTFSVAAGSNGYKDSVIINNCPVVSNTVTINNSVPAFAFTTVSSSKGASFCASDAPTTLSTNASGGCTPYTYSWSGPGGASGTSATLSASVTGTYNVTVTDNAGTSITQSIAITVNNPTPSVTPQTKCSGATTFTLGATVATAGDSLLWYASNTSDTILATGANYTTPSISSTTTYYVEERSGLTAGLGNTSTPVTTGASAERGIIIRATSAFRLVSAQYYSTVTSTSGSVTVRLLDSTTGTQIYTKTINMTHGAASAWYTMNLDWNIPVGSYRLLAAFSTISVSRHGTGVVTYPFALGSVGQIVAGYDGAVNTSYNYFHNLSIQTGCTGTRVPVTATLNTPPALALDSPNFSVCKGATSATVSATSTTVGNYTTYSWSPTTGVTSPNSSSTTFTPTATTAYTLSGTDGTCSRTASITITSADTPSRLTLSQGMSKTNCSERIDSLMVSGGFVTQSGKIGSGTATNTSSTPFRRWFGGSRSQALYTPAELTALGLVNGSIISSIGWVALSGTPAAMGSTTNFSITAGFVTAATLGAAFITGDNNTVFSASSYVPSTGIGNLDFALSTPLTWDGSSHLLVASCFNNNDGGGVSSNNISVESTTVASGLNLYLSQDNNATVCTNTTAPTTTTNRPNLRLTYSVPNVTWSPTSGLFTNSAATVPYSSGHAAKLYTKNTSTTKYYAQSQLGNCIVRDSIIDSANTAANMVTLVGATTSSAIAQCTDGGWTYYGTAANPDKLIFAIQKGSSGLTGESVSITVDGTNFSNSSSNGANQEHKSIFMKRSWDVTATPGFTPPVNVRFFYDATDSSDVVAARDADSVTLKGSNPNSLLRNTPFTWFKSKNTAYTAWRSTNVRGNQFTAGTYDILTPLGYGNQNGIRYVEFAVSSFSGGTGGAGFGPSGAGGGGVGLPVTWAGFEIETKEIGNELTWKTASEKNTDYFQVEYSYDALQWSIISGQIPAAGNSADLRTYTYTHSDFTPFIYYRIKQVDLDGQFEYSVIKLAKRSEGPSFVVKVYPIPMENDNIVNVSVKGIDKSSMHISMSDITGKVIRNLNFTPSTEYIEESFDMSPLAPGVYFIEVQNGQGKEVFRVNRY
ncbi:MAG: T9SS type A sorting domain-containing protein [Chitinophagales bacterium]|nr:T9SS type A sorting domain-containing protein [Chitinophagales bacterium]